MLDQKPDIVFVVFDTSRRDRFGCYGYDRDTTPTVDALAREGRTVRTMIANAPWTLPSHASLFTGLYPSQHGAQWQTGPQMNPRVDVTLAEWLRDLGYETICATNNGLISDRTGLARGFGRYAFRLDLERGWRRKVRRARKAIAGGDSGGRVVNRWIRQQLDQVKGPVFLFVNYLECHWSYTPPRSLQRRIDGPRYGFLDDLRYRLELADRVGPWEAIARADQSTLDVYSTLYDAEHRNVDAHLAELLDIMAGAGRLRDGRTLVVVTSDHGEHIGEHGLADHHASLDEHLIGVPFVAWGPGLVEAKDHAGMFEFVDVFPSMCRFLGGEPPPALANRRKDLFSQNGSDRSDGLAFAEWRAWTDKELTRLASRNPSYDFGPLARDLVCVRDERYKLVRTAGKDDVVHDLANDPDEQTDVSSSHPEVARRLGRALDAKLEEWGTSDEGSSALSDDDAREIEEHLSALGYI